MQKYILFTGCTGVGKSFIIEALLSKISNLMATKDIKFYSDPYVNNPFLTSAYQNKDKCFQSQIFFFKEFLKIHKEISCLDECIIFQERSIFESVRIFCKLYDKQGLISHEEYDVCEELLYLVKDWIKLPDFIVNINSDLDNIQKRIMLRGRSFEDNINLTFTKIQKNLYEKFLTNFANGNNIRLIQITNENYNVEYNINKIAKETCLI